MEISFPSLPGVAFLLRRNRGSEFRFLSKELEAFTGVPMLHCACSACYNYLTLYNSGCKSWWLFEPHSQKIGLDDHWSTKSSGLCFVRQTSLFWWNYFQTAKPATRIRNKVSQNKTPLYSTEILAGHSCLFMNVRASVCMSIIDENGTDNATGKPLLTSTIGHRRIVQRCAELPGLLQQQQPFEWVLLPTAFNIMA
jgi:hypothetical protein